MSWTRVLGRREVDKLGVDSVFLLTEAEVVAFCSLRKSLPPNIL